MDKPEPLYEATMPPIHDPEIYRTILESLRTGVGVLDLHKKIIFWNDGAELITGYARIDVLGHSCTDNILLHCDQIACEMCSGTCPIKTALHDARPVEAASFIHHKSGHRTPVHAWTIPLRDQHGSIIATIHTFETEFAAAGPDPNDQSMKDRGCLDDLTGLPNQALMYAHLREVLVTFAELHIPFGVVCLEAHNLSQFRARYGQEAARSVLQVLARTLRNTVWPTDFVGSWSEGQFLVILSGCNEAALQAVSQRMLKMMAGASITWWGEELSIAVSLGRTAAVPGDTVDSMLQRAQQALTADGIPRISTAPSPGATSSSTG
jgi:diguanylate cyclase (GGDEF)-like protein/PAS domain S-box-containing protein